MSPVRENDGRYHTMFVSSENVFQTKDSQLIKRIQAEQLEIVQTRV